MQDKLCVIIDGRSVMSVLGTRKLVGMEVQIIDFDTEGADKQDLEWVCHTDGSKLRAFRSSHTVEEADIVD